MQETLHTSSGYGTARKHIAVFDFDGTLTTKDSLLMFIIKVCGPWRFGIGFLMYFPILVLMKFHLYPNWKAKERICAHFFRNMTYESFRKKGIDFATEIAKFQRKETVDCLKEHIEKGHKVYVISASIEEWVAPFCHTLGNVNVLSTKISRDLTHFLSRNCYGREKVNRLLEAEPDIQQHRGNYFIHAYGDSNGDREMLAFADEGKLIRG